MRERKAETTSIHIAQVVQEKNYLRTMRTFQVKIGISNRRCRVTLAILLAYDSPLVLGTKLRFLISMQENFDSSHRQLLETLNAYATVEAEPHLTNLCSRLDFNGYFARLYGTNAAASGGSGRTAGTQRGLVSSVYGQT